MVNPVPGYSITTSYGKAGGWSCGFHTGVDYAAPKGAQCVAAIAGTVRHRNYGSALGNHQFAISPDPGEPFGDGEIFYAHTYDRPQHGSWVNVGVPVAHVGTEGNVTGPHLHFEYHPHCKNCWGCGECANPQVVIDHNPSTSGTPSVPSGVEQEDEDMFVIDNADRGSGFFGPGYFHQLNNEERAVMQELGVRIIAGNVRQFDVARAVMLYGESDMTPGHD